MNRWISLVGLGLLVLTAGVAAQDAPDYGAYRLIDVQELDLPAGPASSAAHLSPDGARFAHFERDTVCIYARDEQVWTQDRCFELDRAQWGGAPEEVNWSPDSRFLTLPTYQQALVYLKDTDILVLDTENGTVINLTDDGADGGLMSGDPRATLDMSPVWVDSDTLRFIRYAPDPEAEEDDSFWRQMTAVIAQVDLPLDGAAQQTEVVLDFPQAAGLMSYLLAADAAGGRVAVNLDERGDDGPFIPAVWQEGMEGQSLEPLAVLSGGFIRHLDYSADGQWLMALLPDAARIPQVQIAFISTGTGEVVTLDLETSGFVEPRLMVAGWSPVGDALAYVVRDDGDPNNSGLYIAAHPGEPGNLILPGEFYGTTCCMAMSIGWAANDVIMIGRAPRPGILLVQVGE